MILDFTQFCTKQQLAMAAILKSLDLPTSWVQLYNTLVIKIL